MTAYGFSIGISLLIRRLMILSTCRIVRRIGVFINRVAFGGNESLILEGITWQIMRRLRLFATPQLEDCAPWTCAFLGSEALIKMIKDGTSTCSGI